MDYAELGENDHISFYDTETGSWQDDWVDDRDPLSLLLRAEEELDFE